MSLYRCHTILNCEFIVIADRFSPANTVLKALALVQKDWNLVLQSLKSSWRWRQSRVYFHNLYLLINGLSNHSRAFELSNSCFNYELCTIYTRCSKRQSVVFVSRITILLVILWLLHFRILCRRSGRVRYLLPVGTLEAAINAVV